MSSREPFGREVLGRLGDGEVNLFPTPLAISVAPASVTVAGGTLTIVPPVGALQVGAVAPTIAGQDIPAGREPLGRGALGSMGEVRTPPPSVPVCAIVVGGFAPLSSRDYVATISPGLVSSSGANPGLGAGVSSAPAAVIASAPTPFTFNGKSVTAAAPGVITSGAVSPTLLATANTATVPVAAIVSQSPPAVARLGSFANPSAISLALQAGVVVSSTTAGPTPAPAPISPGAVSPTLNTTSNLSIAEGHHGLAGLPPLASALNRRRILIFGSATKVSNSTAFYVYGTPGAATAGTAYTFTPGTVKAVGSVSWAFGGVLPTGWAFTSSTGTLSCASPVAGTAPTGFTLTATDSNSPTAQTSSLGPLSIVVNAAAPTVPPCALISGGFAPAIPPPSTLMLDTLTTSASSAYSTRRIRGAYTGPLIQVTRASDGATLDVGYTSGNKLDTAALATFCAGTTGSISKWYDQSGNARHSTTKQSAYSLPTIFSGGFVTKEASSSAPAARFGGNSEIDIFNFMPGSTFAYAMIASVDSANNNEHNVVFGNGSYNTAGGYLQISSPVKMTFGTTQIVHGNSNSGVNATSGVPVSVIGSMDASNVNYTGYLNGAAGNAGQANYNAGGASVVRLGEYGADTSVDLAGYVAEMVSFGASLPAGDVAKLSNSQQAYFTSGTA